MSERTVPDLLQMLRLMASASRRGPIAWDVAAALLEEAADRIEAMHRTAHSPPQRWECEVRFNGYGEVGEACTLGDGDATARAKLGFDFVGRVWFADAEAKRLAQTLRYAAAAMGNSLDLLRAAVRLAGPEI